MAGLKQVIGERGGFLRLVKTGGTPVRAWSIPISLDNSFLGWSFYVHAMRGNGSIFGEAEAVGTNLVVKANIVAAPRLVSADYPPPSLPVLYGGDGSEDDLVSAVPGFLNDADLEITVPTDNPVGVATFVTGERLALGYEARLILDLEADEDEAECPVRAWFATSTLR